MLLDSTNTIADGNEMYYDAAAGTLVATATDATKIGKGTGATTGAAYTTDPSYTQFNYTGTDVSGHSIKVTFHVPTNGTESSCTVAFN